MAYKNEWKEKGLHRQFTGVITGREVLKSNIYIQGDERFDDIKYVFNDFTQIEGFEISDINIAEIAAIDNVAAIHSHKLKIIILATNKDFLEWADHYLTHMDESPFDVVIFEDMELALKSIP